MAIFTLINNPPPVGRYDNGLKVLIDDHGTVTIIMGHVCEPIFQGCHCDGGPLYSASYSWADVETIAQRDSSDVVWAKFLAALGLEKVLNLEGRYIFWRSEDPYIVRVYPREAYYNKAVRPIKTVVIDPKGAAEARKKRRAFADDKKVTLIAMGFSTRDAERIIGAAKPAMAVAAAEFALYLLKIPEGKIENFRQTWDTALAITTEALTSKGLDWALVSGIICCSTKDSIPEEARGSLHGWRRFFRGVRAALLCRQPPPAPAIHILPQKR